MRESPFRSNSTMWPGLRASLPFRYLRVLREIVPLAAPLQRVILAQGVAFVILRHQDAAEVRVALEVHPVHVERLALGPVCRGPKAAGGLYLARLFRDVSLHS